MNRIFENPLKGFVLVAFSLFLFSKSNAQSVLENTQVRFFTSASAWVGQDTTNTTVGQFEIDPVLMLLTGQVGDKFSYIVETGFKMDGTVDIDRLMLKYTHANYLHFSLGKLYTPLGLWTNTFYKKAFSLAPVIDHPQITQNPDDGGMLNVEDIGFQVGGEDIGKLRFGYRAMMSNGFGEHAGDRKTFTGNVFIEPVDNLKFSVSYQNAGIEPGDATGQGIVVPVATTLTTFNAGMMYYGDTDHKLEGAIEFTQFSADGGGNSDTNHAYFAYAGYKVSKRVTPYVLYNHIDYEDDQSFFIKNNYTGFSPGVRFNIAPLSVLKIEGQFLTADEFKRINKLEMQLCFGF